LNKLLLKKYQIVGVATLFLILAACFFVLIQDHLKTVSKNILQLKIYTITETKEGFSPAEITINQNDVVKFISTADKEFWPASDPHPTHTDYSEFDPKQPIESNSSWSFTFDKTGDWKFHDHLFFTHRGVIHVLAGNGQSAGSRQLTADSCKGSDVAALTCWGNLMNQTLADKGLDAAFDLMANLYTTNPDFAEQCHTFAHTLGQDAYKEYAAHKDVELSTKATYCGYGFYHGFMESLLADTGSPQQAQDFCAYVGKKLNAQTTDAEGACYHGIGHGTVDGGDAAAWGNAQAMLDPGIKICQLVAGEDKTEFGKMYRCVSGAYNALQILADDPKYKLTQIQKDPFYICPSQPKQFWEACYTNMLPEVLTFTKGDFIKAAKIVEAIPKENPDVIRPQVMLSVFHEWIRINLTQQDYAVSNGIKICRSLDSDMQLPCIEGLSGGHMKYGEPQQEYVKALGFCKSDLLKQDEQSTCYGYILPRLRIWYSVEKTAEICSKVPQCSKQG
jgi:plastocyanin